MEWQYTPYTTVLLIAAVVAVLTTVSAWRRRSAPGTTPFGLMTAAAALWSLGYALELSSVSLSTKVFWVQLEYIGIVSMPLFWFMFAVQYTHRGKWLNKRNIILLSISPILTLLLKWTNPAHGLMWADVTLDASGSFITLDVTYGWWFWVHTAYSYLLLLGGTALIVRLLIRSSELYRRQGILLMLGILIPWVGNALTIFDLSPLPNLDLTPLVFVLSGVVIGLSLFRFRFLDITPVAHQAVIESMGDGMLVLDLQNRIVDHNPAAQKLISEMGTLDLVGKHAPSIFTRWPQVVGLFQEMAEDEPHDAGRQAEVAITTSRGARHFDVRLSPLYNARRQLRGRVVVFRDVTTRKQREETLHKLSRAVEQSASSIVITDTDGKIEFINARFTELNGYTFAEVEGKNPNILKSGQTPAEVYTELWQTILGGEEWRGELQNKKKNGDLYWVLATVSPIKNAAGEITHFLGVQEDITEQKRAAEERRRAAAALAQARDEAMAASRLKSQLLANVSHDLRSPLGSILGFTEMLQEGVYGPLSEPQIGATNEIVASTDRLLNFVNNLLGQAQIESGKVKLNNKPFAPAQLLETIQSTARVMAQNKGVVLSGKVAPDMPATITGDLYWLQQILANLVGNAVKFTDQGSVEVRLYQADETHWAMQVCDTGPGIPSQNHSDIFEPFHQVDGTVTSKQQTGSGLGLSIVKQLTDLMEGEVKLSSKVGEGSTFTVLLPLTPIAEETL